MSEYFPVLASILFIAVVFIVATHKGVVSLLASGISTALAAAVLFWLFEVLPGLATTYSGLDLGWKFALAVSASLAFVVFVVARIFLGLFFRRLFNAGSPLHRLVDGIPGGILSLVPGLVAVLLFFTCVRAAGTVRELNHVDSLAQAGIERMGGKIPSPPASIAWRNTVERIPFVASLLDAVDPFSRRTARNAAALVLISGSIELRAHLLALPETGVLVESGRWAELASDPAVAGARAKLDRVALVTAPAVQEAGADPEQTTALENLVLLPSLKHFADSLVPIAEPETEAP